MVLRLVDDLLRMFDPDSHSKWFSLYFNVVFLEQIVNIPRRVAGRQDNCFPCKAFFPANYTAQLFAFNYKAGDLAVEVNLSASVQDAVADGSNYTREFVSSDVRTRINKYIFSCAMCYKSFKNILNIAALIGPRV